MEAYRRILGRTSNGDFMIGVEIIMFIFVACLKPDLRCAIASWQDHVANSSVKLFVQLQPHSECDHLFSQPTFNSSRILLYSFNADSEIDELL